MQTTRNSVPGTRILGTPRFRQAGSNSRPRSIAVGDYTTGQGSPPGTASLRVLTGLRPPFDRSSGSCHATVMPPDRSTARTYVNPPAFRPGRMVGCEQSQTPEEFLQGLDDGSSQPAAAASILLVGAVDGRVVDSRHIRPSNGLPMIQPCRRRLAITSLTMTTTAAGSGFPSAMATSSSAREPRRAPHGCR